MKQFDAIYDGDVTRAYYAVDVDKAIAERDAEIKRRGECMNRLFNFVDQYAANHYHPEWSDWFDSNGRVKPREDEG